VTLDAGPRSAAVLDRRSLTHGPQLRPGTAEDVAACNASHTRRFLSRACGAESTSVSQSCQPRRRACSSTASFPFGAGAGSPMIPRTMLRRRSSSPPSSSLGRAPRKGGLDLRRVEQFPMGRGSPSNAHAHQCAAHGKPHRSRKWLPQYRLAQATRRSYALYRPA